MKKKLVVLVGGYYPYYGNPMGNVLESFVVELNHRFDVTVLALKRNATHKRIEPLNYKGSRVITISSALHEAVLRNNIIVKMLLRLLSFCKLGRFDDYWIGMMSKGLSQLYKVAPFEGILSLGFPMQMHEAARKFRLRHPAVRWVTYSTDSCYGNPNLVRIGNEVIRRIAISRLVQREEAFRNAADYNFVSREIFVYTAAALRQVNGKCDILDYTVSPKRQECNALQGSCLRIVYAGGMSSQMRDPSYFLRVFCSLPKSMNIRLDVYFLGEKPEALIQAERASPERIIVHPAVSPQEIERIYEHDADVLLNLGNNCDVFSPSKLFGYISTGKPIIDVYYPGRPSNPVVMRHPFVLRMENYGRLDHDVISLQNFLVGAKGKRLSFDEIKKLYADYAPEAVVEKIAKALN